jgi:hypothetical protein
MKLAGSLEFVFLFALFWLGVTTLLGFLSGWYDLMRRYPDRPEVPLLSLKYQSGMLGLVGLRGVLHLGVCSSGIRMRLVRLFGPFCRDIFLPWQSLSVSRRNRFLWRTAILQIGGWRLSLDSAVADRLARAAGGRWPEPGPFPKETNFAVGAQLLGRWLAGTTITAAFFVFVPLVAAPAGDRPPIAVAILFPAIVFGVVAFVQYSWRHRD